MDNSQTGRRRFLQALALGPGAVQAQVPGAGGPGLAAAAKPAAAAPPVRYPRAFTGRQLAMIAFPLGGVAAGSISLGGRGQLRDWEIFNRPDKGNSPAYAFPGIFVQTGRRPPVAKVLEAEFQPPYEGPTGLGYENAPGLRRLRGAAFTGEYPFARVAFRDPALPVKVSLEAFTPWIPHRADDSGLPVAVLRYTVRNPGPEASRVAVVFSIDNPVGGSAFQLTREPQPDPRTNEFRKSGHLQGLFMQNPELPAGDPLAGTFALAALDAADGEVTYWRGWPSIKWWASPRLFWDEFSANGRLGPEAPAHNAVGSLCLGREIAPGAEAHYTFLLSWHFPNRTPARCGWKAPRGEENAVIGNHYCRRFGDAWQAAEHAAGKLPELERRTREFVAAVRAATVPDVVKDAAMANLSTLATQTCFRTADGAFHGFEGCGPQAGCCFGNAVHVWNYEIATDALFPELARSLRESAFLDMTDGAGKMGVRQLLPAGKEPFPFAAADGQMGQLIKLYLDWKYTGDTAWLRKLWPAARRALEFAWVPGGWDGDRDGVMEGAQHTIDVEFYGPYPLAEVWYLGALRAGEEIARAVGEQEAAARYRALFERGSRWTDENLFNGEYYIQKIRGIPKERIAEGLLSGMGSENTEQPDFQLGEGCLLDQLVGQYLAHLAGLGHLVRLEYARKTLHSILKYNRRRDLHEYDNVQRTFALNDEPALIMCHYPPGKRVKNPFPVYAEVMTGFEYQAAVHMIYEDMVPEALEIVTDVRRRYDGERRNPWNEAECGHHYARAMAAWSLLIALSGFEYDGGARALRVTPRLAAQPFRSFWSTGTGWGTFERTGSGLALRVTSGSLALRSVALPARGAERRRSAAAVGTESLPHEVEFRDGACIFRLRQERVLGAGERLELGT